MTADEIRITRDSKVLTLEICRPERKNAFTNAMYWAMIDALAAADADSGINAVIITGQPDIFSSGNDLNDFLRKPELISNDGVAAFRLLQTLAQQAKPVIAAVCGPAVGIGATLLLHCDLVYGGESASFHFPFVRLGLCAEGAASLLLPRVVGLRQAEELLLTGGKLDAVDAEKSGLINRVLPDAEALPFATRVAHNIASMPAKAILATKTLLRRNPAEETLTRMEAEMSEFTRLLCSEDAAEAIAGVLRKK